MMAKQHEIGQAKKRVSNLSLAWDFNEVRGITVEQWEIPKTSVNLCVKS